MKFIDLNAQQKKIRDRVDKRINRVLNHGKYIMGPEVFELEEALAEHVGVKYCISCSSGTDALLIPLMAKGIGPGDAVITTTFTYIATAEVISLLGATPVFVDIYPETFNINVSQIQNAVDDIKKNNLIPKAIIAVDLFGLPARYRLLEIIAKENKLFLIQDSAQGFGSSIRNKKSGGFGDVASTSFFPAKPLGCYGDGGAIFTNDKLLRDLMHSIRIHGSGLDKYDNLRIGINGRLDTIQAAILLEKFSIFDIELKQRNKIANYYNERINPKLRKPYIPQGYISSWAQYSLLATSESHRNKIMRLLKNSQVPSMIYYKNPLHLQRVFDNLNYAKGDFPISEKISKQIFSIPMHPYLTQSQQDKIIRLINNE